MTSSDRGSTISVRPLSTADADTCDQIILTLPHHFGHEGGRRQCAHDVRTHPGLVATLDDRVVGFLIVQRHLASSAEITWMAVHAAQRRHGIGRALIRRLCDQLSSEGCRLLLVFTLASSAEEDSFADGYSGTRAFYQSQGFIPARELPDYWPGSTALLLVRPLTTA
jgi:ribosomal protein S18 acetylase RimI-like enzyme